MAETAVSIHLNGIIDEVDNIWENFNSLHRCSIEMRGIIKDYAIPNSKSMKAEEIDLESNFKSYESSHGTLDLRSATARKARKTLRRGRQQAHQAAA